MSFMAKYAFVSMFFACSLYISCIKNARMAKQPEKMPTPWRALPDVRQQQKTI